MSDDEDYELKRLRMQRMQALLKQKEFAEKQSQQKFPTLNDRIEQVMNVLLQPNALQYIYQIKQNNEKAYNFIINKLFPAKIVSEIDLLINYLQQGLIRRGIISLIEVQQLERQALGIGPTIRIKKQGQEATSLGNYLKDDE